MFDVADRIILFAPWFQPNRQTRQIVWKKIQSKPQETCEIQALTLTLMQAGLLTVIVAIVWRSQKRSDKTQFLPSTKQTRRDCSCTIYGGLKGSS